jgi:enamine deaminase RidA (YjgF/YER057c/UK114 family)
MRLQGLYRLIDQRYQDDIDDQSEQDVQTSNEMHETTGPKLPSSNNYVEWWRDWYVTSMIVPLVETQSMSSLYRQARAVLANIMQALELP